jgi:hypothetical protein
VRPYNGPWDVALGFGAFGWGRKRLVRDGLTPGSGTLSEGGRGMAGVGMTLNVGEWLGMTLNVGEWSSASGVYGGGGA